jgi:UDP-N-acetylmuramyl tripeptide synthase
VAIGHAISRLSRLAGLGAGGVIGGRVILRVAPRATREMAGGRNICLITGTNGKTTTAALLTAGLRVQGPVVTNADGANTPAGFVTALASGPASKVVLETDEGWLPWAVIQTRPRTVVLLNLSRDQLTRHYEVNRVSSSWREALAKTYR